MPEVPINEKVKSAMWKRYFKPAFSDNPEDFRNKIIELAEDYIISNNLDENEIKKNNTYFTGIIKHIYINLFNKIYFNYADVNILDTIWNTYTNLAYIYNKYPSILEFSILTGINYDTIKSWSNNGTRIVFYIDSDSGMIIDNITQFKYLYPERNYSVLPSTAHFTFYKKMLKECENSLRRGAGESNKIGSIFLLKSLYGYTEIAPIQIETAKNTALTAADLPQLGNNSGLLSDNSENQE